MTRRLANNFFENVPVKTTLTRNDDKYETPISISNEAMQGNRKVKVYLSNSKPPLKK